MQVHSPVCGQTHKYKQIFNVSMMPHKGLVDLNQLESNGEGTGEPVQSADGHTSTIKLCLGKTAEAKGTGEPVTSVDRHTSTMEKHGLSIAGENERYECCENFRHQ